MPTGLRSLRSLMRQTVTIEPLTGRDSYGAPTYGAAVPYRARVVGKVRQVRGVTGEERVSTHTVYLAADVAIAPTARVTLPAGYEPGQPPILAVGRFPDDGAGLAHTVLYLE